MPLPATLDLNLLVAFDALCEERSVTRAARRLGITQPALSNALQRLRAQLDDPLFVRAPRGVVPTARAQELEPAVRAALRQIEGALAARPFTPASATRSFRIMMTDYMEAVLLPGLLARLAREAPAVDVEVIAPAQHEEVARAALERGDVDLALGVATGDAAGVQGVTLFSDPFLGLARVGHPALDGKMTLERWVTLSHVLVAPRGGRTGFVDTALAERGLSRRIHVRTPHFASAPQLLVGTDLVLTLAERAARVFAAAWGLALFKPPVPLPSVAMPARWHERNARDPAHRWLRRLVVDVAKQL